MGGVEDPGDARCRRGRLYVQQGMVFHRLGRSTFVTR